METVQPGTDEWAQLREEIIDTEDRATAAVNEARDALLAQGDLFAQIAPPSTQGVANGTYGMLEQMAKECGIAFKTAEQRRHVALQTLARQGFRERLAEASDIVISWTVVANLVTRSRESDVDLTRAIKLAREAGQTRIKRDDVRRQKFVSQAAVGTPQDTAAPITPEFARQVLDQLPTEQKQEIVREAIETDEAVAQVADEVVAEQRRARRAARRDDEVEDDASTIDDALALVAKAEFYLDELNRKGRQDQLRILIAYAQALLESSVAADDLTPEMFQ